MYPQKTACRIPLLESVALGKPRHRSVVVISTSDDVIFRWVWGGKPTCRFLVQTVTCETGSAPTTTNGGWDDARFILFISFTTSCIVTNILHKHRIQFTRIV